MTVAELHILRRERSEIKDLLADIRRAEEWDADEFVRFAPVRQLAELAYLHETLALCLCFRAEQNLF